MKYRNTITGVEIEVGTSIQGGTWELIEAPASAEVAAPKKASAPKRKAK